MKLIILTLFAVCSLYPQTYTVYQVTGKVDYRVNGGEEWIKLLPGENLDDHATISTGENSSVQISGGNLSFKLNELSVMSINSIKKMSLDDLLLALALEDMLNAPKNIEKTSGNTAVYGTREGNKNALHIKSNDFGIKRLNGAVQLAEIGFQESAVVTARETFRKYPDTKSLPGYRIFFADILYSKGLFEEALAEYTSISELELTGNQKNDLDEKLELIRKKLANND